MQNGRTSRDDAIEVVRSFVEVAESSGRDDLVLRISDLGDRLADPAITLVVVGEYKQGKSSLVNALLQTDVCAVDDAVPTSLPTFLRHARQPSAAAVYGFADAQRVEDVPLDRAAALTTADPSALDHAPTSLVLGLPRQLLEGGLVVVDTPGIGGLDSRHGVATAGALGQADAVIFVSDASQELTATELDFLLLARRRCPTVALALTKVDINPAWRKIAGLDRGHLEGAELDVPLFPVASPLRRAALDAESGYDDLEGYVLHEIVARADAIAIALAAAELDDVADHLEVRVTSELQGLRDGSPDLVAALQNATVRSGKLESAGGRWQVALDDGLTDLSADLDHKLQTTLRQLRQEADALIDGCDPAQSWGELEPLLNQRIMTEVLSCYSLLDERLHQIAADIAEVFRLDEHDVAAPLPVDLSAAPTTVSRLDQPVKGDSRNLVREGITALKGIQGGVVVFGMVAQLAGLALTGPATVAVGIVMGGRSLREERKRQLALRRQRAKAPVRKVLDEIQLVVAKDTKDRLRHAKRALRDAYGERSQVLHRSTQDALAAAERAIAADAATRQRRLPEVEREREALDRLRAELRVLVA